MADRDGLDRYVETARYLLEEAGFEPTEHDLRVIRANERLFGDARRVLLAEDLTWLILEKNPDFGREPSG